MGKIIHTKLADQFKRQQVKENKRNNPIPSKKGKKKY